MWFYSSIRYLRADNYVAGVFVDTTQDDPNVWAYTPDTSQKALNSGIWKDAQARLTWQATPIHKLAFSYTQQTSCKCPSLQSATQIGGTENRWGRPQRVVTADWTAPLTSRLLVDASVLHQINKWGFFPRDSAPHSLIGFLEQSNGMNLKTRPRRFPQRAKRDASLSVLALLRDGCARVQDRCCQRLGDSRLQHLRAAADSVPTQQRHAEPRDSARAAIPRPLDARCRARRVRAGPLDDRSADAQPGRALRLQAQPLPRADHQRSGQRLWDGRLRAGTVHHPRNAAASLARHHAEDGRRVRRVRRREDRAQGQSEQVSGWQAGGRHSAIRWRGNLVLETYRSWRDDNRDFTPDCDLLALGATASAGRWPTRTSARSRGGAGQWDPRLLSGWGVRGFNWEFSTSVQREVLPQVSVDVGYFRRWYGNLHDDG